MTDKFRLALLLWALAAQSLSGDCLHEIEVDAIVGAIYRVEGAERARVPYGILSIKPTDPKIVRNPASYRAWAKRICQNTVRNNGRRWRAAGAPGCFLDFLGDVYCPKISDLTGNRNWKANIHAILKHK